MTKLELEKILNLYQDTENTIRYLDNKFGICLFHSNQNNFYNNYNLLIRKLLEQIFTLEQVDLIEYYIFNENNLTFDELYKKLNHE